MKPTKHTTVVCYDTELTPFKFFVVNRDLSSTMKAMKKAHETIVDMFADHYPQSFDPKTTYLNYGFLTVLEEGQSLVRYAQEMEDYQYTLRSDDEDLSSFLDAHPSDQYPNLDVLRFNSTEKVPPLLKPFFDGVEDEEEIKKSLTSTRYWNCKRDEVIDQLKKEFGNDKVTHDFNWDAYGYVDSIEVFTSVYTYSIYDFGDVIRVFTVGDSPYCDEIDLDQHPHLTLIKEIIKGVKNG